jgi:hypothetical protein
VKEMSFITVNVDTSALFVPATRAYGNLGIAGFGVSGSQTEAKVFETQSAIEAEYGADSAIAKAASLAFQNGAKTIYCIRAAGTAATQQNFVGDGVQTVFQLSLTEGFPQQGSLLVEVDSVEQIEGTDYYVDYGNGTINFYVAPGDTLTVDVDFNYIAAADLQTALALFANQPINIVVGAMIYESPLLEKIKDHVNAASADGFERIGVAMLPNGNSDGTVNSIAVVGVGGSITNEERMACFGSTSVDDIAAACAGMIAKFEPWISIILKPLSGVVQLTKFTTTELTDLKALQVNAVIDVDIIVGSGLYTVEGFNLAADASRLYIDIIRVIDDISFRLKSGLTNPNTIGTLKINAEGLRTLRSQVRAIMANRERAGEIDSFDVAVPLLAIAAIPTAERTDEQQAELNNAKSTRQVDVDVGIVYSGAMHAITVNLKFV